MGRNSVEATNACLIRAARAALADLPACVLRLPLEVFFLLLEAEGLVLFLEVVACELSDCAAAVRPVMGDTASSMANAPASTRPERCVEVRE